MDHSLSAGLGHTHALPHNCTWIVRSLSQLWCPQNLNSFSTAAETQTLTHSDLPRAEVQALVSLSSAYLRHNTYFVRTTNTSEARSRTNNVVSVAVAGQILLKPTETLPRENIYLTDANLNYFETLTQLPYLPLLDITSRDIAPHYITLLQTFTSTYMTLTYNYLALT